MADDYDKAGGNPLQAAKQASLDVDIDQSTIDATDERTAFEMEALSKAKKEADIRGGADISAKNKLELHHVRAGAAYQWLCTATQFLPTCGSVRWSRASTTEAPSRWNIEG